MRRSLVAGVVLVVALAACGSGSAGTERSSGSSKSSKVSTLQLVAQAPAAAADAKSAHISGRMTIDADGQTIDVPISADTDFETGATQMTLDMSSLPGMAGGGRFEVRLVDGAMYMKLGSLLGDLRPSSLAGKDWVAVDISDVGVSQDQLTNQNPADMLESLRGAGAVEELGSEDIDGVSTHHFRAQIDTAKALERVPAADRREASSFLDAMGSTFPMDVWIDDDGLPRRFEMDLSIPGTGSVKMRMDFSDFGAPVDVTAPTPDETVSMSELQALGAD